MSNDSDPEKLRQLLADCHESVQNLCSAVSGLHGLLGSAEPDWNLVHEAYSAVFHSQLQSIKHRDGLDLFEGLRPDAIEIEGQGYGSWHAAMHAMFGEFEQLRIWIDPDYFVEKCDDPQWAKGYAEIGGVLNWQEPELVIEASPKLGFPGAKLDRMQAWRLLRMVTKAGGEEWDVSFLRRSQKGGTDFWEFVTGWVHLKSLDVWRHFQHLRSEFLYAQRELNMWNPTRIGDGIKLEWDAANRVLNYSGEPVLRMKHMAKEQESLLAQFQVERWARVVQVKNIAAESLRALLNRLNKSRTKPHRIFFHRVALPQNSANGGLAVGWTTIESTTKKHGKVRTRT